MKYALFDKNGFPIAFYDPDIHSNIPENAIQISDEQWMEFLQNQGRRRWNFEKSTIEVYDPIIELTLDELKEIKLQQLERYTPVYIERYYPEIKQRSDIADKEYYVTYLLATNNNYTSDEIYKRAGISAYKIFTGQSTLEQELTLYPEEERQAWEQLIKIALRVQFVQAVKEEYRQYLQMIQNAQTKEELEAIKIEFKTRWPL